MGSMKDFLGIPRPAYHRSSNLSGSTRGPYGRFSWTYNPPSFIRLFNTISVTIEFPNGAAFHRTLKNGAFGVIYQDSNNCIEYLKEPVQ